VAEGNWDLLGEAWSEGASRQAGALGCCGGLISTYTGTAAHEAGGLYPYTYAAAKTLLRQVNYSNSCASSSVAVSLLAARAYSEGMEYIEVLESSAKRAHLLFRQAALLPNSSHRGMHFFVFNGLGHGQLCTVT